MTRRTTSYSLSWLALGAAALLFSACSRRDSSPNLLLVTLDTTRADRIGCYGYERALTPVMDELAQNGVLFENTFSCVPLTLPAHASILTGLYPPEHGLRLNGQNRLDPSVDTVTKQLRKKGYRTGAFIAAFVLDSQFGLDDGFETYNDNIGGQFNSESWLRRHRSGDRVVDAAIAWLADNHTEPFFCWVHLFDPHNPYNPHVDLFGDQFTQDPYSGEIAFVDLQIGRLIQFLKRAGITDDTLVVIVGDHGESLGEHGERQHGMLLYNGAVKVPLIISQPGVVTSSHREEAYVSIVDVAPTVLDMLGCTPITKGSRTLQPSLMGETLDPGALYAETDLPFAQYGWAPLRAAIVNPWKFIETAKPELYDLETDLRENNNLADASPELLTQMYQQLVELESTFVHHDTESVALSDDDKRALESLGYVSSFDNRQEPLRKSDLPDVKDMIHFLETGNEVRNLIQEGNIEQALTRANEVLLKDPQNKDLLLAKAAALAADGQLSEAETTLRDLLSGQTSISFDVTIPASMLLSKCRHQQGDSDEALAILRDTLNTDPRNVLILNELAWFLATRDSSTAEDCAEAVALAEQVIDVVGLESSAKYADTLAAAYAATGRFSDAVSTQEQAMRLAKKGENFEMLGQFAQRLDLYRSGQPYSEKQE